MSTIFREMQKNMSKRYTSVADAAAFLADDDSVRDRLQDVADRSNVSTRLQMFRTASGRTQEQVATEMRCSPSKISRLETGTDDSLTWTDLTSYCQAIGVKPTLLFEPQHGSTAERVTLLVRTIHEQLERLADSAGELGGEEDIIRKIHAFYGEVLFPLLLQTVETGERSGLIQPAPAFSSLGPEQSMKRRVAEPPGR
jgi:transcriptional regulator with XRE-family HTH domain